MVSCVFELQKNQSLGICRCSPCLQGTRRCSSFRYPPPRHPALPQPWTTESLLFQASATWCTVFSPHSVQPPFRSSPWLMLCFLSRPSSNIPTSRRLLSPCTSARSHLSPLPSAPRTHWAHLHLSTRHAAALRPASTTPQRAEVRDLVLILAHSRHSKCVR